MLALLIKKGWYHRKCKVKSFENHEEFLTRIVKSLYYVEQPLINYSSLPVTELASEIFSQANKLSLNRLDIEKAAHFSRNASISPCLLVLALLYLERLKSKNPSYLSKVSPTELFLISLMVGSKFLQDDGEGDELSNIEWANLTGLKVQEINKAEKQFLDAINWEVFVSKKEFWKRFKLLESDVGLRQGCKRGWFTYSELNVLLQLIDLTTITQCLWNVITACLLSYTASVLTLLGSTLLVGQIPGLGLKPKVPVTDVTNNWTQSVPSFVDFTHSNGIQDCNMLSSPKFALDSNDTNSEFFKLLQNGYNFSYEEKSEYATQLNFFQELYLLLSTTSFFQMKFLLTEDSSKRFVVALPDQVLIVQIWSDCLRNYLIKTYVPATTYVTAGF